MAQDMSCERALQLSGQVTLSGEVLAARWHVQHCARCQQALNALWTQVALVHDQHRLEQLLGINLSEATWRVRDREITWLEGGTNNVLASLIRLNSPAQPSSPNTPVVRLGSEPSEDSSQPEVLHQAESESDDQMIKWKMTCLADAHAQDRCVVEVQVDIFDRWDMVGIVDVLSWAQEQRKGQTDAQGVVRFLEVPISAIGSIEIILCPPQIPSTTNGPQ